MQAAKIALLSLILVMILAMGIANKIPARWEYKVIFLPDTKTQLERLNLDGMDGWDIAASRRATGQYEMAGYELILKRRR